MIGYAFFILFLGVSIVMVCVFLFNANMDAVEQEKIREFESAKVIVSSRSTVMPIGEK